MSYSERDNAIDNDAPCELENEHVLRRIKKNDPKITYMEFVFLYGHGSHVRDRFVTSVDWDTEQWSFFENSHLLSITIDICLLDNTKNKSRNATPKDLDNVRSFTKALARNRSIKNIRLQGDPSIIGDIFINVSPMFGRLHGLELINTTFTNDSIQKLKIAIESCGQSELQEIELSCNRTTNEQAGTIIDAINGHCNNLKKLVWGSDNGEGLFKGSDGFLALANLVGNPSSVLEVLDLGNDDSYTEWWDDSMPEFGGKLAFATAIANNSTLKVINFGGWSNSFTTSEWQIVLSILRHNSIEEIYLYGQQIGVEGMNAITLGLPNNTSLKKLDLGDCGGVTFACLASLSDEIQNNRASALETLDISSHITRRELTMSITRILIDNTSLKELSLCGQWDTRDDIIIELANVLENNDTLKVLNLGTLSGIRQHHIDEDQSFGFKALTRILCNRSSVDATFMSNHTLQTVSLYVQHGHVYQSAVLPSHLTNMLTLNENSNKFEVSRQKILQCHFDGYQTQEFVKMELEVLPHALAWCGEDQRGVSLLYSLVKSQASLFDPNSKKRNKAGATTKRKRNE